MSTTEETTSRPSRPDSVIRAAPREIRHPETPEEKARAFAIKMNFSSS